LNSPFVVYQNFSNFHLLHTLANTKHKVPSTKNEKSRAKQRGTSSPSEVFGSSYANLPSCLADCFAWPQVALTHHVFKGRYTLRRARLSSAA